MKSRNEPRSRCRGDRSRPRRGVLGASALLTSALVTGILTAGVAHAADEPVPATGPQIRITEIAYGGKISDPNGDGEYVELTNVGDAPQSFAGWTYTGKPGSASLPLDGFGTVDPGQSVLITDVAPAAFRADWHLSGAVKIIDDKANGYSVTLDKGPDTPTVYDSTKAVVDSVSYAAGFFPGKGASAWPDQAHLGAKADTTGWTLSTAGDAEGSVTSSSGSVGSPGQTPLAPRHADIQITELAYGGVIGGSAVGGDGEYTELTNVGNAPQDFTGWTYTGKPGTAPLSLSGFGTVAPGESVLITDVTPAEFRTEWNLPDTVKVITDGKTTLDKGPDTPMVFDSTNAVVDSVSYAAGFFPGKGASAWPDQTHVGTKADTTGWTLSTVGDAEGSVTSASGAVGSPGSYTASDAGASNGGSGGGTPPTGTVSDPWRDPSSAGITAQPWPGPQAVTTSDNMDFGQNLSGLFYVAGATPADDYLWGVENGDSGAPLNTGQSSLFKIVRDANGNWGAAPGWQNGIKLHYPDGTGQPDAEGVTAVGGKVFISTERDNANNTVSKVSILEYDPSTIANGAINAVAEWDLADLEAGPNPILTSPADANLGAEAVTFIPDGYLVANGFKTDAGVPYDPATYGDHQGGLFLAGIEKNGTMYGYVLQDGGAISRVATFSSGFNQIMDAMWDPSQDALWLDCDNGCQGQTSIAKLNTTAGDPNQGHFQTVAIFDRPTGGPNVNNEGFTAQPASECDPATNLRSVWWSDDSDDSGHALRTAKATCATPIAGQVGATVTVSYTQQGTTAAATTDANGAYTTPVTATFTCTNRDAVLNQPCPVPIDIVTSQDATTVATLTDTLGTVYTAGLPAISIQIPTPAAPWDRATKYAAGDRVTYLGVTWEASRDINGQQPGKGKFWIQIVGDGYPLWTSNGTYLTGDRVIYQGEIWEASRDINGQQPGKGKFWILVG